MATTSPYEGKVRNNYRGDNKGKSNAYPSSKGYQKRQRTMEEDYDDSGSKSRKHSPSKAKSSQSKEREQIPDKYDTMKRLEREKKVMKKKYREEDFEKERRPQIKNKKTARIDWTKEYEFGLLDEDENYTNFL